jgi:hypothetical protein
MKCGYSREILALYIEDDLPAPGAREIVHRHLSECAECEQYCEQLRGSQSLIRARLGSRGQDIVSADTLAGVRHAVMSQIGGAQQKLGWTIKLERLLLLGFQRQRYAVAGFAIVAIVSASLLGQIRHSQKQSNVAGAMFVGKDKLVRPAAYREWVFVGSSLGHNVYINPDAYREYSKSGKFPEGTVMVQEMVSMEAVRVSVKDSSRFEGGWGYFDFAEGTGTLKSEAEPLAQTAGCLSCHQEKAATDHVFTQFYPVLRLGKT